MGESKMGDKVRKAIKAAHDRRLKAQRRQSSKGVKQVMPGRRNLSTRGERGDTWQTERWTSSREKDRAEMLERRRKMAVDARAKAVDKATHIERHS